MTGCPPGQNQKFILQGVPVGVWEWTPKTHTLTWDENLYRIAGLDPSLPAPTYHEHQKFFTPESWERLDAALKCALEPGISAQFDLELVRPDGAKRWLKAQWEPVRAKDGGIRRVRGILHDVTDHNRGDLGLHESEATLRLLVKNASGAVAMFDREMHYLVVSKRWIKDYELHHRDLRDISHYEVFPEIPETWKETHRKCLDGAESISDEYPFPRADGRVDWVRWEVQPWRKRDYNIGGIIIFSEIVTRQREAAQALRSSEERLGLAQHAARMGVFEVEFPSGRGTWSPRVFEILGLPSDFLPRNAVDLVRLVFPEDRKLFDKMMIEMLGGKAAHREYRIRRPDGEIRWVEVYGERKTDNSGQSVRFVGTCVDITARKRAEEEKHRSFLQLRALAARLQHIREEERTRLAREIHDELGQSFTAIKMHLNMLIRDFPADRKELFQPIFKSAQDGVHFVRRMARELRPVILDTSGLVGAVEWAAGEFTARTAIKCPLNLPGDEILIDQARTTALFRILQEAFTNVARHSEATEVRVKLAEEPDGLIMEIQDNGKGITQDELSAGDSLGIVGMRERAFLLGGELFIHGIPGGGTTLRVLLPHARSRKPREGR